MCREAGWILQEDGRWILAKNQTDRVKNSAGFVAAQDQQDRQDQHGQQDQQRSIPPDDTDDY